MFIMNCEHLVREISIEAVILTCIGQLANNINKTGLQSFSRPVEQVPKFLEVEDGCKVLWYQGCSTDRQTDRQINRPKDRQIDRKTDRQTNRPTDRPKYYEEFIQTSLLSIQIDKYENYSTCQILLLLCLSWEKVEFRTHKYLLYFLFLITFFCRILI